MKLNSATAVFFFLDQMYTIKSQAKLFGSDFVHCSGGCLPIKLITGSDIFSLLNLAVDMSLRIQNI